MSELYKSI